MDAEAVEDDGYKDYPGLTVREVMLMLSNYDENLKCVIVAECGNFRCELGRVRLEDDECISFTSTDDMNCC